MSSGTPDDLDAMDIFAGLDAPTRAGLIAEFDSLTLSRGDALVRQGDEADHLYIVLTGRFAVTRAGRAAPINEIGPGHPVGEIAFFAGGTRTATVTALRDSLVLRLARQDYDRLAARLPSLPRAVTAMLARRLGETTAGRIARPDPRPRTIAVVPIGDIPLGASFATQLQAALARLAPTLMLDEVAAREAIPRGASFDSTDATEALNTLERRHDYLVYLADRDPTPWSLKAVRQADLALLVAHHDSRDASIGALESQLITVSSPSQRRLVLLHATHHEVRDSARWLGKREVAMHHHVALDETASTARLARFIHGSALGLVAGGGGAFCMAHGGLYKALTEAGYAFDMMGGTSGGSAMTAGFAAGVDPDEIDRLVADAFVTRRAMRRFTVPRYGLIDHTAYDAELAALYGDRRIEDLWIPYFCVSTNLSENRLHLHRDGLLWQAVRASSAIPVLLPPFYTRGGDMLVDGGLVDNVPIKVLHDLKSGPNVVISLEAPKLARFDVDYARLPARGALLRALANPFRRKPLPAAPSIGQVLLRTLVAHRRDYERHLEADDLHLQPPLPPDMGLLDWHRHEELFRTAYDWGIATLKPAPPVR